MAQAQLVASKGHVSIAAGVDDAEALRGEHASDAERLDAAKRLVLKSDDASDAVLLAALRDGASPNAPAVRSAVARAILAVDPGSPRFGRALRDALGSASTAACVADLLAALDQYPVRPTVSVAVDRLLSEGVPEDIRTLLCQAVSRWTACEPGESPGADRAAWERWWSGVRALDDAGWNAELARNF